MIEPGLFRPFANRTRWSFLQGLPATEQRGDHLFVHGSPRDPIREYVMKTDVVFAPEKMADLFARLPRYGFGGHTHQPGVFIEGEGHRTPDELGGLYRLDGRKAFVNIGSVGQPRDGHPASCFVVLSGDVVEWVRVPYDIAAVQAKIRAHRHIDDLCAERLAIGR